ncbi:MAG: helicase HerA-like domain-containing protein [Hyphomicrobiaceae bacterium]
MSEADMPAGAEQVPSAFEHSITWEADVWQADPMDVEAVHVKAREKFRTVLTAIRSDRAGGGQARMLLFHGQSGAGKTHLIRALRTEAHRQGQAYFGYAQMSPDIANYADYFLRRLVSSLEKPYSPDGGSDSGLSRLTARLVDAAETVDPKTLERLREAAMEPPALARLVMELADDIVASPAFAESDLDVNIIRALLYLQRSDPRIDQRVRQYLYGRSLNELSQEMVAALDPNDGEGRAFEIIESLGRLMWIVDRASLVFCIDQVEDLRFFSDANDRFQKAVRDLIQIANRVPTSIVIISCLGDFYADARASLAQSYIDRIEKSGPVLLAETRTAEEARLIIEKRLAMQTDADAADAEALFGPDFFDEFAGLSTRRLLEHAYSRIKERHSDGDDSADSDNSLINMLAAALAPGEEEAADFRAQWERFLQESEAEIPTDEQELMDVLTGAIALAGEELGGLADVSVKSVATSGEVSAADVVARFRTGQTYESRLYICNRSTQGGAFKRQLDKVLQADRGKMPIMLRASNFPPNKKNQTAQAYRKFLTEGGRGLVVPIHEWERMMNVRTFEARHGHEPGFASWLANAKLLSSLPSLVQVLRLDLHARPAAANGTRPAPSAADEAPAARPDADAGWPSQEPAAADAETTPLSDAEAPASEPADEVTPELPLAVWDGAGVSFADSLYAGHMIGPARAPVVLTKSVLKRHAAVLGGSGSGKTTLALSLIEQLLLRGTPVVLIDRKGDLCSYANPDVWRVQDGEASDRWAEREKLGDAIDVAVYTPGRGSGRPISITLLPNGIRELPEHEQQLLANLSAAALGDMLHLKNSATHQRQSGVLSVALKILGARSNAEVTLGDLILLLEDEDPELSDHTQRMDPSGKIRRDLVAQLDSLRHRNAALFEGGGESLRMESLLGLGRFARPNRTRLSIIYTGFLGDNENILFWVSQFLSEALRFCQRNPNDELQAVVMFDEADLYIPANAKPATAEPLQSLLKRARSAGLGLVLATQSPGDLDYKSRDQITSWFIGRVREDTALRKLRAAFQSESGLDPASVLPGQTVGEFHLVQEGKVRPMKAQRSMINAEQVPFDRIEQLARETKGYDEKQLGLFDRKWA